MRISTGSCDIDRFLGGGISTGLVWDIFGENGSGWAEESGIFPAVDIIENEKSFKVKAELAGMNPDEVDVSVTDGFLTIKGERQEEKEEKKKDYYLHERHFGSFERSFDVP